VTYCGSTAVVLLETDLCLQREVPWLWSVGVTVRSLSVDVTHVLYLFGSPRLTTQWALATYISKFLFWFFSLSKILPTLILHTSQYSMSQVHLNLLVCFMLNAWTLSLKNVLSCQLCYSATSCLPNKFTCPENSARITQCSKLSITFPHAYFYSPLSSI
jgi:hypothetical protein